MLTPPHPDIPMTGRRRAGVLTRMGRLALLLGLLGPWGCAVVGIPSPAPGRTRVRPSARHHAAPSLLELRARYRRAILDARVAEPGEVSRRLTAIVPRNRSLIWSGAPPNRRVLVVTWTGWTGYDARVGRPMTLAREVWVTVAPQVAVFCRQRMTPGVNVPLRLAQLLGLPPRNDLDRFVELWVAVDDLFRPSPDPEVTDHEAELTFPRSGRFVTVSPAYRAWFLAREAASYGEDGYPWTRLGYTYDWGNSGSEVGLSEFVVRTGARVTVHSVTATRAYCRPAARDATGAAPR